MKIFLTGGTGFIGSYFIDSAISSGYDLKCLRRPGSKAKINYKILPDWIDGELEDDYTNIMMDCECFVHMLACGVSPQIATKEDLKKINITQSFKLIQSGLLAGIKKFLIIGSAHEYGKSGRRFKYIPPDAPLEPISDYAKSKVGLYKLLKEFVVEQNLKMIYTRLFNVYGLGQHNQNFWPSLREAAISGRNYSMTSGEQIRCFSPVEDVAKMLIDLLDFSDTKPGNLNVKNIASGPEQSLKNFAEYWWGNFGAKGQLNIGSLPYRKNEIMRFVPLIEDAG